MTNYEDERVTNKEINVVFETSQNIYNRSCKMLTVRPKQTETKS